MPSVPARPKISVVVPIYNEQGNLVALDREIRSVLEKMGLHHEIVYVDDRSTDGSYETLQDLVAQNGRGAIQLLIVRLRRNYGQTAALAAGFRQASGEQVVALDGDGQNDPADIPRLVAKLDEGYDVVSGWRRDRHDRRLRVNLSRVANVLISVASGVRLHDTGCTLKAYRKELLDEIRLYGEMHRFIPVYLARQGAKVTEIEVAHRSRKTGASKYGSERIVKVLLDLVVLLYVSRYFSRPMHFFGQVGFFFAVCATGVSALMLLFKFGWLRLVGIPYQADLIQTPLPSLAATFFVASVTALLLGVLAELLVRIYYETEGHRPFHVERVDGVDQPASENRSGSR